MQLCSIANRNTAEFPETETNKKIGKVVFQQDSNQQLFAVTDDFDDDEPLPQHHNWLRGEKKPRIFELFKQNGLPPVLQQPYSILPTCKPSQTFQPHPLQLGKHHLLKMTTQT